MVVATSSRNIGAGKQFARTTDKSEDNAPLTVSTPVGSVRRLVSVKVKYSANVTVNPTVTLISGAGPAWDTVLETLVFTAARNGRWFPDGEEIINPDDVFEVVAPAGGAGITSAVAIYTEAL